MGEIKTSWVFARGKVQFLRRRPFCLPAPAFSRRSRERTFTAAARSSAAVQTKENRTKQVQIGALSQFRQKNRRAVPPAAGIAIHLGGSHYGFIPFRATCN